MTLTTVDYPFFHQILIEDRWIADPRLSGPDDGVQRSLRCGDRAGEDTTGRVQGRRNPEIQLVVTLD